MYNKIQKERYIEEGCEKYDDTYVVNLRSTFKKTASFEKGLNKDLSDFSREEIADMYSAFFYSNVYVFSNANSKISMYTEWCLAQNLVVDGCNHYKEFQLHDFQKYIDSGLEKRKYVLKKDLDRFVDSIYNARDAFFVLCLYEFGRGPNFMDISNLKIEDIDREKGEARLYDGKVVKVSDKLCQLAEDAEGEEEYTSVQSGKTYRLVPSPFIFKKVKNGGPDLATDRSYASKYYSRVLRNIGIECPEFSNLTATSIAVSGQMEIIRRNAARMGIENATYVTKHFDELNNQFYMAPTIPQRWLKLYGVFL